MDRTTPETPGAKLLADVTPDLVECLDEFLAKELGGNINFVIHVDTTGKLRKMTARPELVRNYN